MKKNYLISLFLMGFALFSKAQKNTGFAPPDIFTHMTGRFSYQIQDSVSTVVIWYKNSDTLIIGDRIRYIKVGNTVFQIVKHECTIEPSPPVWGGAILSLPPNTSWPPNGTIISPQ